MKIQKVSKMASGALAPIKRLENLPFSYHNKTPDKMNMGNQNGCSTIKHDATRNQSS